MKPFLTKGYAKRKLHTGNQSVQFDEEMEVGKPLFYSTICVHLRLIFVSLSDRIRKIQIKPFPIISENGFVPLASGILRRGK